MMPSRLSTMIHDVLLLEQSEAGLNSYVRSAALTQERSNSLDMTRRTNKKHHSCAHVPLERFEPFTTWKHTLILKTSHRMSEHEEGLEVNAMNDTAGNSKALFIPTWPKLPCVCILGLQGAFSEFGTLIRTLSTSRVVDLRSVHRIQSHHDICTMNRADQKTC